MLYEFTESSTATACPITYAVCTQLPLVAQSGAAVRNWPSGVTANGGSVTGTELVSRICFCRLRPREQTPGPSADRSCEQVPDDALQEPVAFRRGLDDAATGMLRYLPGSRLAARKERGDAYLTIWSFQAPTISRLRQWGSRRFLDK